MAQKHADACLFATHSSSPSRESPRFKQCGESISIYDLRDPRADWYSAIKLWFDEKSIFEYNGNLTRMQMMIPKIGHYTALMWATTSHVGCGYAQCLTDNAHKRPNFKFHNFVCSYCPM